MRLMRQSGRSEVPGGETNITASRAPRLASFGLGYRPDSLRPALSDNQRMNVLFLCTGNSARSILAEALMNARAEGRIRGYSAGSHPKGEVNPLALEVLRTCDITTAGLRSKSWDEFAGDAAPHMDVVITVCDQAAAEACPLWPGAPVKVHWGLPDPAAAQGTEAERLTAFAAAFTTIERRIELLLNLPLEHLSTDELQGQLSAIH
jgi:protein-tyrosine-phosphatase